jgi:hypothetical protein
LLVGLLGAGCGPAASRRVEDGKDPPQVVASPQPQPLAGTLSCSGRGCHADFERPDNEQVPPSRSSYTRWLHHDPHTRAYQVLSEPLAQEMGRKLGFDVTTDKRCLVCHCTPLASRDEPWALQERTFGVGCEGCHGAARDWLVRHRSAGWEELPAEQKERHGLARLSDQAGRAKVCSGCHVGAPADPKNGLPARDMNHDFIAAGHPRLMFEYGAFLANEPKHWKEKDTRPDFEARAWLVGQVVSAKAALELLAARAKEANPWPEFAEYDCYSCHQDLAARSGRRRRDNGDRPGSLRFARWYPALVSVVAGSDSGFTALAGTMARPYPSPRRVSMQAEQLLGPLATLATALEKKTWNRPAIDRLREKLVVYGSKSSDWDELEQVALGLKALSAADRSLRAREGRGASRRDKETDEATNRLLKKLAFPPAYDSPKGLRGSTAEEDLKALFEKIAKKGKER